MPCCTTCAGQRPEDGVPDMTTISGIDVEGVNENLRVRFARDEVYTYTGTILVAVNPYFYLPLYEKVGGLGRAPDKSRGGCALVTGMLTRGDPWVRPRL